ncbi:MAG TPA: hypothetical protein VNA25_11110, partial [Phycisphaerae bacterium]|nr:hypothetical protein [Phycisphaerae bacterium]
MDQAPASRTDREKLALFRACFTGLPNVFGTYDPQSGQVRQVKQPVTDEVLRKHLRGCQPYGVYLLVADRTQAFVVDFDEEDTEKPLQFVRQAGHYGIRAYLERSKRKGWHAWMFMELPGVAAAKARLVGKAILDDIGASATEIFPKQDVLGEGAQYGNFINAPLFGLAVRMERTVFVDPDAAFKPYPNQWDVLAQVKRVKESLLDEIIETNELGKEQAKPNPAARKSSLTSSFNGLLPCARKMIAEGVTQYQRVSCFRLAIHLKKVGLPLGSTIAVLLDWAGRNRPVSGKPVICEAKVKEQAAWAYHRNYRSCGCEDPA